MWTSSCWSCSRAPADAPSPPASGFRSYPGATVAETRDHRAYWKANLRLVSSLLGVWFLVSYGFGILLVDVLNQVRIPGTGFPLGFWFAQQGSIYVFVALIFFYVWRMNRLDAEFGVDER